MASETTTTSAVDSLFAKWFDSRITEEIRPQNVSRPFLKFRGKESSNVYRFTYLGDPGAASSKAEGSAMNNTQLTTSGVDVTAGTIGMQATITDENDAVSLYSTYGTYGPQLMRSLAEKFETDVMGLVDGFSNTTGTTTVDLYLSDFLEASIALAGRDATGSPVAILHTRQVGDLRKDLATSTASVNSNPGMVGNVRADNFAGYQDTWYGVPVYQTTLVNTMNAAADRGGAIFIANDALGLYEIWGPRSEVQRELGVGTAVAVTQRYGVGELRDDFGQTIVSDA